MKKRILLGFTLLVVLVLSLGACGILQAPEEASAPLEVIPVDTGSAAEGETAVSANGVTVFTITPGSAQARFELDEDLRGSRITVVGTTDQVAGEIATSLSNLADTKVGVIQVNARTLATDNNFRNRALSNEILDTGAYEYITFTPTAVNGLPDSVNVGDSVEFTVDGDLTIREATNPVTFAVRVTAVSPTQLQGTASATVTRSDYGLNIPSVPNVANVEEEVELYIDFTANAS
ncbi:MAG: YceI family protein [Ardenticatenaceae bacterium]|nr:YceI family protein [Ardenticatenaceae bacterium]